MTTHRPYLLRTQGQERAMTGSIKAGKRSALTCPAQEDTDNLPRERRGMEKKCHIILRKRQQDGQSMMGPSEAKGAMTTFFGLRTGAKSILFFT